MLESVGISTANESPPLEKLMLGQRSIRTTTIRFAYLRISRIRKTYPLAKLIQDRSSIRFATISAAYPRSTQH